MKPYKFELTFKEGDALHVEFLVCFPLLSCPVFRLGTMLPCDNITAVRVYILIGADGGEDFTGMSYYIGQTTNLQQRLNDHRRKKRMD